MKHKIVLCALLLMFGFADLAVGRNLLPNNRAEVGGPSVRNLQSLVSLEKLPYKNLRDASQYSTFVAEDRSSVTSAASRPILLNALPFKNILNAGKWSRMLTGRALMSRLKKNAHVPQDGDEMFMVLEYGGGGCNWSCCFKQCMGSAMAGTGTLCTSNCTACGMTGNAWPCAVCVGCGTVGFAAIEFCSLHCCVDPGC
ncbi:MAG TPA: hypothetical protein VHQ64_07690 [Pyrinomonadaceae bacterium]|jgi:hypothetical protein|nr:hypothetical protein [Pyrinomonadaceae bacterium]